MGTMGTNGVPVLATWKFGLARAMVRLQGNAGQENGVSVSRSSQVPRVPNVPGAVAREWF